MVKEEHNGQFHQNTTSKKYNQYRSAEQAAELSPANSEAVQMARSDDTETCAQHTLPSDDNRSPQPTLNPPSSTLHYGWNGTKSSGYSWWNTWDKDENGIYTTENKGSTKETKPREDICFDDFCTDCPGKEKSSCSDSSSKFDASSTSTAVAIPPDGGWGWMVCLGSFMCNFLADGFMFSFGIFYVELMDYFKDSMAKTAAIGSALLGTHLAIGPVVSALTNRFGCQKVAMTGGLVASTAFALSSVSPNVEVMVLVYGILGGVGIGMLYLPAIVIVGMYFEKRRALANGIGMCGAGIGTMVISILTKQLIGIYGWRGAMLISSGLVLNTVVGAALFRPLEPTITKSPFSRSEDELWNNETHCTSSTCLSDNKIDSITHKYDGFDTFKETSAIKGSLSELPPVCGSLRHFIQSGQDFLQVPNLGMISCSSPNLHPNSMHTVTSNIHDETHYSRILSKEEKNDIVSRPMYRKNIFYSASVMNLPEFQSDQSIKSFVKSMIQIPKTKTEDVAFWDFLPRLMRDVLREMTDFSLFRNPAFIILVLSNMLWTGVSTFMTYLPDLAIKACLSKDQVTILLVLLGTNSTIGRVAFGFISDKQIMNPTLIYAFALIGCGVVTTVVPFSTEFWHLAICSGMFGICVAGFTSLRSITLVRHLGIDKLTNAFGIVSLFQGISFSLSSPIAGSLYNITNSYTCPFVVAGVMFVISGAICIPLKFGKCSTKMTENVTTKETHNACAESLDSYSTASSSAESCDEKLKVDDILTVV